MLFLTRARLALGAAVLILFIAGAAGADPSVTVFVGKTAVPATLRFGRVFAPVDPLLRALGYSWTVTNGGYSLKTGAGGGPSIDNRSFTLYVGTKSLAPPSYAQNGKVWIDVRAMAEGLGAQYVYTPAIGVAQISFTGTRVTESAIQKAVQTNKVEARREEESQRQAWQNRGSATTGSAAGSEENGTTVKGKKPAEDEPIAVDHVDFYTNNVGLTQGTIALRNDADKPVRNVFVYITMMSFGQSAAPKAEDNGGQSGLPSVATYVKPTNDNSLPTYGGSPPTDVSGDYPGGVTGGVDKSNPYDMGSTASAPWGGLDKPSPTPTPEPSPQASPSPTPSPKPVGTLAPLLVAEIAPGQTISVPFTWNNPNRLNVTPSVETRHDKVDFTRKKKKEEGDESVDKAKDEDKSDKSKDKTDKSKSDDKADKSKSDDKADKSKSDDKGDKSSGADQSDKSGDKSTPDEGSSPTPSP